jgi:hypothetical protein
MKVVAQLIRHFWQRGVLTPLEAAYLRRHGFCRDKDLPGFKDPRAGSEVADLRVDLLPSQPDALELIEDALVRQTTVRRGGSRAKSNPPSEKELLRRLRDEFAVRAAALDHLLTLAQRLAPADGWTDAAARLHAASKDEFHAALRDALVDGAVNLGELWQACDAESFHGLVEADDFRGPAARAFQAVLTTAGQGHLGGYAWVLKHGEVQALVNLLAVNQRLVRSVRKLYRRDRGLLARALRSNQNAAAGWALVILYNAHRHPELGDQPRYGREYGPIAPPAFDLWKRAWTVALQLDRAAVTRFLETCYASGASKVADGATCARPLMCPAEWSLPAAE